MDNARIHHCNRRFAARNKGIYYQQGQDPCIYDSVHPRTESHSPRRGAANAFSVLKQNVRQEKPKNATQWRGNERLKSLRISKKQIDSVMSENIFKKSFGLTAPLRGGLSHRSLSDCVL